MPKATFPTTLKGWGVAVAASLIGFLAGLAFIALVSRYTQEA
jgi:hypothetical protein